jgi:hypothetical protein
LELCFSRQEHQLVTLLLPVSPSQSIRVLLLLLEEAGI